MLSWELLTGTTPYKDFNHANVVYGVANNVLKLPIPKTCPEGWAKLMTSEYKFTNESQMLCSIELHDFAYYSIGCWEQDPHKRPSFKEILQELDVIAQSGFGETPNESFHTMQDGWKKEINEVLRELRNKEKVRIFL